MALPTSGSLSIKATAGTDRSIACEIDGDITGNKSLLALGNSAFGSSEQPHSMSEFYGYSSKSLTLSTTGLIFMSSPSTQSLSYTISPTTAYPIEYSSPSWVSSVTIYSLCCCIDISVFCNSSTSQRSGCVCFCHCGDSTITKALCVSQQGSLF